MAEINFSPEASEDLKRIRSYIVEELANESAAKNVLAGIFKRIRILESFPEAGAPLSDIVGFDTEFRFLPCGSYTVFYRYELGTVFVIRILYGKRDIMKALFGSNGENLTAGY